MSEIQIYTTTYCGFCRAAKSVLDELEVAYEEVDVTHNHQARRDLVGRARGKRTVPQIFIDGEPIGGYMDLIALKRAGELSQLLNKTEL